jgi:6-pyruvoyltetrahydropterin/6-carboxytetrahydropterin synthase
MLSCSKTYKDIPFAHRQPLHEGHCSKIHGHNWSITLEFQASELDKNGFVVDFGKLKYIKAFIDSTLDHACLFSKDDAIIGDLANSSYGDLFNICWVENASCEGIALFLYETFSKLIKENEGDRVSIKTITLNEDAKNFVTYTP